MGVKQSPLWKIDPLRCITPLLHLEIGLFGKSWKNFLRFLDDKVELIPKKDQEIRKKLSELVHDESKISDEHTTITSDKLRSKVDQNTLRDELKLLVCSIASSALVEEKEELKVKRKELSDKLKISREKICAYNAQLKDIDKKRVLKNKEINNHKKVDKNLRQKRVGLANGLDTLIDDVLKKEGNIYREAYHGGELNGVCVRQFLENSVIIMEEIKVLAINRRNMDDRFYDNRCSIEELRKTLDTYCNLFRVMDLTFSLLRIAAPTKKDIKEAKETIFILDHIWKNLLKISRTPKAHILLNHTLWQYEFYQGIANKCEDFVEKGHQVGKRLEHLTNCLPSGDYK